MAGRPWPSWLLVGPTGSGKTPLGDELERRGFLGRRCVHFDFGANLRTIAAAPELESVRTSLATGALFEDKDIPMIVKIVERFAEARNLTPDSLLVLNGLPRHRRQAEGLAGVADVERVIRLEAPAAVIRERIRLDPGGDRAARIDDTLEEVERRLAVFRERTLPLVSYYRELRALIVEIPVTAPMTAAEAYQALVKRLARDP
ncbi:MAG: nucleoside monophosphate kinase [Acidobacteria bacterium]|nr:nucleoside monophosphate kinase [Acidobacteriota bacterium]